ncbi:hypothetical protein B0H13DRAFT_2343640 [Mycena leptocephala]|nr:hypothetical protein B0H13DRAFT_2343640 [Mycena leptocephala]
MVSFLCIYGWAILHGSLAVLAAPGIVSSSWRKPNVTLSSAERVTLASAALERSVSAINTDTGFRATVYYQMADFDDLTNQTMYEDQLLGFISAATKSQQDPAKPESVGHAAIRAYAAYKNPANIASGSVLGKDFPLQLSCQGATMVGGTFETTNSTDPTIAGFASPFSALLAEATSDPIYLDAALDSADFIMAHLFAQNLVQSGISAGLKDACALDNATNSFNTGLMIEGLAVLYSITNNASTQATLDNLITATISNAEWQTPSGIITQGGSKRGDKYIVRGLAEAYVRGAISADLRPDVQAYIGVQFNAVVDLATEIGAIYGGAWTGPPSAIFSQSNQTTAISALLSAIPLKEVIPTSTVSPPSPPSASSSVFPHPRKTRIDLIVGSVVGGVVLVAIAIGIWFIMRRRRLDTQQMSSGIMSSATPISVSTLAKFATTVNFQTSGFTTSSTEISLDSSARNSIAKFDPPLTSQASPKSPTPPRPSIVKPDPSSTLASRYCVNDQPAQSPVDEISPTSFTTSAATAVPSSSLTASSPVELPTTELVRLLNERLRGQKWDEEEIPPEYGTDR